MSFFMDGSKKEITIVDIPSPGILGGVYSDLILALCHSMNSLGFKVSYERDLVRTANPVIIFGLYREFINNSPQIQLPPNYFNFNLAPILGTHTPWFQNYLQCACKNNLIDYSYSNISYFNEKRGTSKASYLFNFGYFDLMPFKGPERGDSYLFYGKLNQDRIERLKSLQNSGLKLNVLHNVWGHERDIQIRKAKAIVNIGKYNPNILEVYRIWHSLCLGTPVYSDAGIDEELIKHYSKYVSLSEKLEIDSFLVPPVSVDLYKRETSFIESVKGLLTFINQ
ncbi:MAG: hypothetical protein EBR31_05105 [Methylophilaceae bacterium]|nr:hypothetical protein [Methylophilaceae bacterium]